MFPSPNELQTLETWRESNELEKEKSKNMEQWLKGNKKEEIKENKNNRIHENGAEKWHKESWGEKEKEYKETSAPIE